MSGSNLYNIFNTTSDYLANTVQNVGTYLYGKTNSNNSTNLTNSINNTTSVISLEHTDSNDPFDQCRNYISRKDRPRRGKREKTGRVTKIGTYYHFDPDVIDYFKIYKTINRNIKSTIDTTMSLGQFSISSIYEGATILTNALRSYPPFKSDQISNMSQASISFSGGGYNCAYHLGTLKYIFEHQDMFSNVTFLGASGGAGVAAIALAYQNDSECMRILQNVLNTLIKMADEGYSLSEQVNRYTTLLLEYIDEKHFQDNIRDSDRLQISVTDVNNIVPFNKIVTKFRDLAHLEKTLRASACIPILLDSQIREIDGNLYLDGGFTNNLPALNTDTIRVSCLNYPILQAEIHPNKYFNVKMCFIHPGEQIIIEMMEEGYVDFVNFVAPYIEKEHIRELETEIENLENEFAICDFEL